MKHGRKKLLPEDYVTGVGIGIRPACQDLKKHIKEHTLTLNGRLPKEVNTFGKRIEEEDDEQMAWRRL